MPVPGAVWHNPIQKFAAHLAVSDWFVDNLRGAVAHWFRRSAASRTQGREPPPELLSRPVFFEMRAARQGHSAGRAKKGVRAHLPIDGARARMGEKGVPTLRRIAPPSGFSGVVRHLGFCDHLLRSRGRWTVEALAGNLAAGLPIFRLGTADSRRQRGVRKGYESASDVPVHQAESTASGWYGGHFGCRPGVTPVSYHPPPIGFGRAGSGMRESVVLCGETAFAGVPVLRVGCKSRQAASGPDANLGCG